MQIHVLKGQPDIPVQIRVSSRARRMTLRVSQLDGAVTVTIPSNMSCRKACAFAQEKETWIRKHVANLQDEVSVGVGSDIPIEGVSHKIVAGRERYISLDDRKVLTPKGVTGPQLKAFMRMLARDRFSVACDLYSERLDREYKSLSLRDTRSRWGSCSSHGNLMFSWRLIMAPSEVIEYVAAHEVAHLAHMNHSRAFWSEVERIHGPYQQPREWLRKSGNTLHRYRFTD